MDIDARRKMSPQDYDALKGINILNLEFLTNYYDAWILQLELSAPAWQDLYMLMETGAACMRHPFAKSNDYVL